MDLPNTGSFCPKAFSSAWTHCRKGSGVTEGQTDLIPSCWARASAHPKYLSWSQIQQKVGDLNSGVWRFALEYYSKAPFAIFFFFANNWAGTFQRWKIFCHGNQKGSWSSVSNWVGVGIVSQRTELQKWNNNANTPHLLRLLGLIRKASLVFPRAPLPHI